MSIRKFHICFVLPDLGGGVRIEIVFSSDRGLGVWLEEVIEGKVEREEKERK